MGKMSALFNVNSRPETELAPLGRLVTGFSLAGRIELSAKLSGSGMGWWGSAPHFSQAVKVGREPYLRMGTIMPFDLRVRNLAEAFVLS